VLSLGAVFGMIWNIDTCMYAIDSVPRSAVTDTHRQWTKIVAYDDEVGANAEGHHCFH
jgi:hypothetical protein